MNLTISDIAKMTGLAPSAIRYYESIGIVPKVDRKNGRRIYNEKSLSWMGIVMMAKEVGFSLEEIRQVVQPFSNSIKSPSKRWEKIAKKKIAELNQQVIQIQHMKQLLENILYCNCPALEDCGNTGLEYMQGHKNRVCK